MVVLFEGDRGEGGAGASAADSWRARTVSGSVSGQGERGSAGAIRERTVWNFQQLIQPASYVRITHRQAATRAIREDCGLGLATGTRFDDLVLEPVGRALAGAFLQQRVGTGATNLQAWLLGWLRGDRAPSGESNTLLKALSPEHPAGAERDIVRALVIETSTATGARRRRLARAIGRAADLPDLEGVVVRQLRDAGHAKQADEIVAARAFGEVLDRTRDAIAELTRAVQPERGGVPVATIARDGRLRTTLVALRASAKHFFSTGLDAGVTEPTSRAFASALLAASDDKQAIRLLVERIGSVLGLSEDSVIRGALFRIIEASDAIESLEEGAASNEPDRRVEPSASRTFTRCFATSVSRERPESGVGANLGEDTAQPRFAAAEGLSARQNGTRILLTLPATTAVRARATPHSNHAIRPSVPASSARPHSTLGHDRFPDRRRDLGRLQPTWPAISIRAARIFSSPQPLNFRRLDANSRS